MTTIIDVINEMTNIEKGMIATRGTQNQVDDVHDHTIENVITRLRRRVAL